MVCIRNAQQTLTLKIFLVSSPHLLQIKSLELGAVQVFNLTVGRDLPKWLPDRKRRKLLREDPELAKRIELIQDFEMPTASTKIVISPNGEYCYAAGTYKPRIRCYELAGLGMKFERFVDADIVAMEVLSEGFDKVVMLTADRSIEFHARPGSHYKTRIPCYGRDMVFHRPSCDLFVAGASSEIYRLNIDQGRFMKPMQCLNATEVNCTALNPLHGLVTVGTNQGYVECFDPRSRDRVGGLDVAKHVAGLIGGVAKSVPEVTTLAVHSNGLTMAAGTTTGQVLTFDIRSSKPLLTKDHQYGLPIKKVAFHEQTTNIVSADSKVVKIYDQDSGKNYVSIEMAADVNDVCLVPNSGLFFVANESQKMFTYFIPEMGTAPSWCSYLDTITDEGHGETTTVYDDYKFVTRDELASLNLAHLIGTNVLKTYMHGFFMDQRLYQEAKAVADPFAYAEYRKAKIEKLLEDGTAKRIQLKKAARALPKVNRLLAKRMLEKELLDDEKKRKEAKNQKKRASANAAAEGGGLTAAFNSGDDDDDDDDEKEKGAVGELLSSKAKTARGKVNPVNDNRFSAMFEDSAFEVDFESEEYKVLHPSESRYKGSDGYRHSDLISNPALDLVEEDESEVEGHGSGDSDSEEDVRQIKVAVSKEKKKKQKLKVKKRKDDGLRFFEVKDGETLAPGEMSMAAHASKLKSKEGSSKSFASRLKKAKKSSLKGGGSKSAGPAKVTVGNKSITFKAPKQSEEGKDGAETEPALRRDSEDRRPVRGLGLKKPSTQAYWRGKLVRK